MCIIMHYLFIGMHIAHSLYSLKRRFFVAPDRDRKELFLKRIIFCGTHCTNLSKPVLFMPTYPVIKFHCIIQRKNHATSKGKMAGQCQYDTLLTGIGLMVTYWLTYSNSTNLEMLSHQKIIWEYLMETSTCVLKE